jgi:hypothetical protein
MITKRIEFGKIEVLPDGQIQLRQDTVIEEDGAELSRTYHRSVLEPALSIAHPDTRVTQIATVIWTPEVVAAFEQEKARKQNATGQKVSPVVD